MKILFFVLVLLTSCTTLADNTPNDLGYSKVIGETVKYFAAANMAFSIDGVSYVGTAVVTHKTPRVFKFNLAKDTVFIDIKTCHRHERFSVSGTTYEYTYIPRPLVENIRLCTMFVDAVTKEGDLKSAEIDFVDKESLTAFNNCNGKIEQTKGASICQSDVGLKQMLQVTEDVDVVTSARCNPMECSGIWCYYLMNVNDCVYAIKGLKSGNRHRLITRGFIMTTSTSAPK